MENTISTLYSSLQSLMGDVPTGRLTLTSTPYVTQGQLAAISYTSDLEKAKENSYTLYASARSVEDAKQAMDDALGQGNWESAGISGDRTQNLLWRVRYGNYNRCTPEYVVIAIGINNLVVGQDTADDTAEGIIAVTEEACRQFPDSKIILLGLFPSGKEQGSAVREQCNPFINCWARIPSELRSVTQILQAGFLTKMERFVTDFTAAIIFTSQTKVMLV